MYFLRTEKPPGGLHRKPITSIFMEKDFVGMILNTRTTVHVKALDRERCSLTNMFNKINGYFNALK